MKLINLNPYMSFEGEGIYNHHIVHLFSFISCLKSHDLLMGHIEMIAVGTAILEHERLLVEMKAENIVSESSYI